jgi:hypothetical protein
VALGLGSRAIAPCKSGTVHVRINKINRVFSIHPQRKVLKIMPVWSFRLHGLVHSMLPSDKETVTFFLPPGISSDEPRYHAFVEIGREIPSQNQAMIQKAGCIIGGLPIMPMLIPNTPLAPVSPAKLHSSRFNRKSSID